MSLKATILDEIRTVAASQKKTLAPLTDDLSLHDSGLDSLCFAILVARLEDILAVIRLARLRRRAFLARSASSLRSMRKPLPETANLAGLIRGRSGRGRVVATRDHVLPLDEFERASSLGSHLASLRGARWFFRARHGQSRRGAD